MADDRDLTYQMTHRYRGIAMVFCYKHFSPDLNLVSRMETNQDYSHVGTKLKEDGFEVIQVIDKTRKQTMDKIDITLKNKKEKLEHSDCFVAVFMSYGEDGVIFAKDTHMMFEDIVDKFNGENCVELRGKPKLFIVQASPPRYSETVDAGLVSKPDTFRRITVPSEANSLIAWNPLPGVLDPNTKATKGSLFIQTFCENLSTYGKDTSVPTIIRKTIKKVCHELEKNHPEILKTQGYKVPYMINLLTKTFVLYPKRR